MNISTYVHTKVCTGYRLLVCATVRALELGTEGKKVWDREVDFQSGWDSIQAGGWR
jgi:hypothetical protein